MRMSFSRAGWVLLGALLLGCVSTFAKMIEQGDALATQGRWDEAASYYERAVKLDPDDLEAQGKLKQARMAQARDRLATGQALLAQGKAREALKPLFEATRFDPTHADARRAFAEAKVKVLARAEADLAAGSPRSAHALARDVLALVPNDAGALRIEATARQAVAAASVTLGQAFEQRSELAPALVEYAEALVWVEGHPDGLRLFSLAKPAMIDRATYHVVVAPFTGDENADDLGASVGAADIARGLPAVYLLRIDDKPLVKRGFEYAGMRLGGAFRNYRYERSSATTNNSCDYICGKETVPNPAYPGAQAEAQAADSAARGAEARAREARRMLPGLTGNRDTARGLAEQARIAVAAADLALNQCRSMPGADCMALQVQRDELGAAAQQAADNLSRAESELNAAQGAVNEAEQVRDRAEAEAREARVRAASTPATVVVDKHCTYDYVAEEVTVRGEIEAALRGEGLYDTTAVLAGTATGRFRAQDRTFPAVRGKCRELEQGKPLRLPSESDVKRAVVSSAVADIQKQVLATYEKDRTGRFDSGRAAEQARDAPKTVDGFLRSLLMATGQSPEREQAVAGIARVLGVSEEAAKRAAQR
jgi:tetratricopeptide (TPR) repeat protein